MAIITSTPTGGRRTARIAPAPTYAGAVARYANQIQQAIDQSEEADRREAILNYQVGLIDFDELKKILGEKIDKYPAGSLKRIQIKEDLAELAEDEIAKEKREKRADLTNARIGKGLNPVEKYEIENELLKLEDPGTQEYNTQQQNVVNAYENAETYRVEKLRTQLLEQYKEGGITNEEALSIIQALKEVANPDSTIFQTLTDEEVKTLNAIEAEKEQARRAGAGAASAGLKTQAAQVAEENLTKMYGNDERGIQGILDVYQSNPLTLPGLTAEKEILKGWREIEQALLRVPDQQIEGMTLGTVRAFIGDLERSIGEREQGVRFDVLGTDNKFHSATLTDLDNDVQGQFKGRVAVDGPLFFDREIDNAFTVVEGNELKAYYRDDNTGEYTKLKSTGQFKNVNVDGKNVRLPLYQEEGKVSKIGASISSPTSSLPNFAQVLQGAGNSAVETLKRDVLPKITQAVSGVQREIESLGRKTSETLKRGLGPQIEPTVKGALAPIDRTIQETLTAPRRAAEEFIQPAVQAARPFVQPIVSAVQQFAQPAVQQVQQAIRNIPTVQRNFQIPQIQAPRIDFLGGVKKVTQPFIQPVVQKAQPIIEKAKGVAQKVGGFLGGLFGRK